MCAAKGKDIFINRELSWLEFNRRVLECSREKNVPIGERLNFAAIYGSNLDEFFMVRVGSLYDQTLIRGDYKENKTQLTPAQQLAAIMPKVDALQQFVDKDVRKLFRGLEKHGFAKIQFDKLDKEQETYWRKFFLNELAPVLSPQIVDRRHPFPFLRDRETYVGVLIQGGKNQQPLFGLVPVSSHLERVITVDAHGTVAFALVEELILHFAGYVFGKAEVLDKCLFRVTRNADLEMEEAMFDHDIDYRSMMSELLRRRRKLAAVRLQFKDEAPEGICELLQKELVLPQEQCFVQAAPLDLACLSILRGLLKEKDDPALFYPPARPIAPPPEYNLYADVLQRDVLLNFPFESIRPFIQMLNEAAADPDVVSIKMTLYRVAADSQVISALMEAAENGKEVVTIVELRARFDEQNNIDWSKRLERAGCTVIYGFRDYKVHSKLTLITKKKGAKYEYISQIGTGNYNEKTSELYTDLSFVTSSQAIGEEVAAVFNNLALGRLTDHVEHLIVAPLCFKSVLLDEMRTEMRFKEEGGDGRIVVKCNSISDKELIETLSEASNAGVPVDMIVRGICCLQAGLPGETENIVVRSLVGRYLEHARIYAFGQGERLRLYIASGDFLTRNTERRVEVGVRIEDAYIQKTLCDVLDMQLADTVNASLMGEKGGYKKITPESGARPFDSQMEMYTYLQKRQPAMRPAPPALEGARETRTQHRHAEGEMPQRRGFFAWLRGILR